MRLFFKISVLLIIVTLIGCVGSETTTNSADDPENSYIKVDQLANHINTIPRLSVRGDHVINTSVSTFEGSINPLFVIDGVQIGRDFGQVLQILDQNQMVSVEFLTSSRATTRYGEEGKNGVLIINNQEL